MNLLVGFYQDADANRTKEFLECIRRNAANPHIHSVTIFTEDAAPSPSLNGELSNADRAKLRFERPGKRLTFRQLFDYANRHFLGGAVVIANADICFDETLGALDEEPLAGKMFCLSRWDEDPRGALRHLDRSDSQDAWMFEPPVPSIAADFFLGTPGCDNRLAFEAERAGLIISNPSRTIRARHLHNSAVRRYAQRDRVYGRVRFVPPSFLQPTNSHAHRSARRSHADFPSHRAFRKEAIVEARRAEIEALLKPKLGKIPRTLRRELTRALEATIDEPALPTDQPLAQVAFREIMGFTIAKLENGASTHNNDRRPITSIPPPLAGLQFTQVVSCHSAAVAIEFRTDGRLHILAAPGWEGYAPAAAILNDAGWRERVDPVRTSTGTYFEVWTLSAKTGERLEIPVQVMLASAELIRVS